MASTLKNKFAGSLLWGLLGGESEAIGMVEVCLSFLGSAGGGGLLLSFLLRLEPGVASNSNLLLMETIMT